MNFPESFEGHKLIGFDSDSEIKNEWLALKAIYEAKDKMKKFDNIDAVVVKFDKSLWNQYSSYIPSSSDEKLLESIRKNTPSQYQDVILQWAKAQLQEMTAMKNREEFITRGILSQNQSGMLFIGMLHLDSMSEKIKKKCEAQFGSADLRKLKLPPISH